VPHLLPVWRWIILGGIGGIVVSMGAWGLSYLQVETIPTVLQASSSTTTATFESNPVIEQPSLTSHPLTETDFPCSECHNSDASQLSEKKNEWSVSSHGAGESFAFGTDRKCAGCHSGNGFTTMLDLGQNPGQVETGHPDPTRLDCQTCHQIHSTNTIEDWALTTNAPVTLFAGGELTFDGGTGNLCANCHQSRLSFPNSVNDTITGITETWGHDTGSPSAMLLGAGGSFIGRPGAHYSMVENSCNYCHMGETDSHTFEANIVSCQACHADAAGFDINGVQTEIQVMLDELGAMLVEVGVLSGSDPENYPIVTEAPRAVAEALHNWLFITQGDKSLGIHNPKYTLELLSASLESMNAYLKK
jgi:hypothetical protein